MQDVMLGGNPVRSAFVLCLFGVTFMARAADFSDFFADRQVLTNTSALVTGSNVGAGVEPFEPLHAGKQGGRSVWISWIAPTNGVVTMSTAGSSFDTLLAVYTMEPDDDLPMKRLEDVASNDDGPGTKTSLVTFGAHAGVGYEIAVDGFAGASGAIQFQLTEVPSGGSLPVIVRNQEDESLLFRDTLILTADLHAADGMQLQWYFNDQAIPGETDPTLVIEHFRAENVGVYRLKVALGGTSYFGTPVEIQINSEGFATTLARDKPADAIASGLFAKGQGTGGGISGHRVGLASVSTGITSGYNGTQVFNTTYATSDPLEPKPCGLVGGASYWFAYQAPTNGLLHLDTAGSNFDTILAVYTYSPPLLGYQSLVPVACASAGSTNGFNSVVEFVVTGGAQYLVDLDGVNGARGIAYLNYWLAPTNPPPPQPPKVTRQPSSQIVALGTTVALDVAVVGDAPFHFQWNKEHAALPGETNATLTLVGSPASAGGSYTVDISNAAGSTSSKPATVVVIARPWTQFDKASRELVVGFPSTRGYQYAVDSAQWFGTNAWTMLTTALTDGGGMVWLTNTVGTLPINVFRLRRL